MRTKENTITIPFRITRAGWFTHRESAADLCTEAVREAFDLSGTRSVDFKITNIKPKNLTGWHIMKKDHGGTWELATGQARYYVPLMGTASQLISMNFPKNRKVYVAAYA